MSEIKVGEYVRTKDGYIAKVVEITNKMIYFDDNICERVYFPKEKYKILFIEDLKSITKHSPNIIDLIEVGDYVNGEIITEITTDPFVKGQINLWTDMELRDVYGDYDRLKYTAPDIKSIVTHEQFEKEEYKLC